MTDPIAVTIAGLAFGVSCVTAWLTLLRPGTVQMTQPTVIFFGPDAGRPGERRGKPKVYLRTLLFSTAKRGRIVESMHVSISRAETHQNFNIWVLGEREKLVRGSGVFVGETGVAANHHFLTPEDGGSFTWRAGQYRLRVYARLLGEKAPKLLFAQQLEITPDVAVKLESEGAGVYFDWGPDSSTYLFHVDGPPPVPSVDQFIAAMGLVGQGSAGMPEQPGGR